MTATATLYIYTGSNLQTETEGSRLHLMSTDAYDSTGTDYSSSSNRIIRPETGSSFSYERAFAIKFTDTFNLIQNVKYYKSAGTISDAGVVITAGSSVDTFEPVNTLSPRAVATIPTTSGTAVDITLTNGSITTGSASIYGVLQLVCKDSVTTSGDIGNIVVTCMYDES